MFCFLYAYRETLVPKSELLSKFYLTTWKRTFCNIWKILSFFRRFKFFLIWWLKPYFCDSITSDLLTNGSEGFLVPVQTSKMSQSPMYSIAIFVHSFRNRRQRTWGSNRFAVWSKTIKPYISVSVRSVCWSWRSSRFWSVLLFFLWVLPDFLFFSFSSNNWLLILSSWPGDLSLRSYGFTMLQSRTNILGPWTFQIKTRILPP